MGHSPEGVESRPTRQKSAVAEKATVVVERRLPVEIALEMEPSSAESQRAKAEQVEAEPSAASQLCSSDRARRR